MGLSSHGWIQYRNLVLTPVKKGLYLRVALGTAVFHRPLFVPWQDIVIADGHSLWMQPVKVTFRQCPGRMIYFLKRDARPFAAAVKLRCGWKRSALGHRRERHFLFQWGGWAQIGLALASFMSGSSQERMTSPRQPQRTPQTDRPGGLRKDD